MNKKEHEKLLINSSAPIYRQVREMPGSREKTFRFSVKSKSHQTNELFPHRFYKPISRV